LTVKTNSKFVFNLIFLAAAACLQLPAQTLNVLYNFVPSDTDGYDPNAGLVLGTDGNFYGTTEDGGSGYDGTVFKLTPTGVLTTLVSFTGINGQYPFASLVQGSDGNFYGTTEDGGQYFAGGASGFGSIFKITPAGVFTTLVSFGSSDGAYPVAEVVQGSDGNFYGTTKDGGRGGYGTVFRMTPAGILTTLATFDGSNGYEPSAGLVQGSDGNFYGTTSDTVFRITPAGVLTTLYSFSGPDGYEPSAGLVQGSDGNFYGTTSAGGNTFVAGVTNGDGTVFKITPAGVITTLHSFNGIDGAQPYAGLVQGSDGNFYGTTEAGGDNNDGTVFAMDPTGALITEVSFDGANGANPYARLVQGNDGNFYGTTFYGGSGRDGVVFEAALPPIVAAPFFSPAAGIFANTQSVTMTSATTDATIRYTTDGSTLTESYGTIYSGPVTIATTTTLNAIAYKAGLADSPVTSGTYSILPQAAAPTFSPAAGTYTSGQTVAISTATSGASIQYTTDGTTPSETNGTLYSGPVTINRTTNFQAIAYETGYADSAVTSAVYSVLQVTTPVLNPDGGSGYAPFPVTMNTATPGATIRYTVDGTIPTETNGIIYNGSPLVLTNSTLVQAIAYESGYADSYVAVGSYYVSQPILGPPPYFDPQPGTYASAQTVSISDSLTQYGARINYTTDGTTPTETHGQTYSGPITVGTTTTISAIAYGVYGFTDSLVTSGTYTISYSTPGWALRDFNGDGNPDILWRNTATGDTAVLLMNGTTGTSFAPVGNFPTPWGIAAVGDFNGDGQTDILWHNATTGEVGVTLMNGTTVASYVGLATLPPFWAVAGLGDFNGDGQTDILLQNTSTGEVGFWALNGTTVTGFTAIGAFPSPWTIAGTGDFNGDGEADLLWYNPTTGDLLVSFMNGAAITGNQGIGNLPLPWTVAGTADFNGDGSVDLLVWNPTTGDTGIFLMNGTTPTSFVPLGNVPVTWQPID
jgi:uncharacterized repeat protein (TIGR03803 family)